MIDKTMLRLSEMAFLPEVTFISSAFLSCGSITSFIDNLGCCQ